MRRSILRAEPDPMNERNRRIDVLHVCETSGMGGAETVLRNIVESLDPEEFRSEVVLFRDGWLRNRLEESGFNVHVLSSSGSFDFRLILALRKLIKNGRTKIVHSHLPDANAYSCIAGVFTGVPIIATYHGNIDSSGDGGGTGGLKLGLVRRLASRVVSVSRFLVDTYLSPAGFAEDKLRIVYNGVDFSRLPESFDTVRKRSEMGFGKDDILVGMLANLRPAKGYEYFIRACGLIAEEIPNAEFLIIGHERDSVKVPLVQIIRELKLDGRVHFLGFREDAAEILACLDLFMLSSITEGLSIATIEAVAARVPVVVTRSGGPEEIVEDGVTGSLVETRNPNMLAEKGLELLNDRDTASRFVESALKSVREKFDIRKMAESYQALYREVIG